MSKYHNETVVSYGKAIFYATIYEDLKRAAKECGWALALHGSLNNDMDLMAMPWVEDAKSIEVLIESISDLFVNSPFKEGHIKAYRAKPNNRVVYTISIITGFYLDINVIEIGNK